MLKDLKNGFGSMTWMLHVTGPKDLRDGHGAMTVMLHVIGRVWCPDFAVSGPKEKVGCPDCHLTCTGPKARV